MKTLNNIIIKDTFKKLRNIKYLEKVVAEEATTFFLSADKKAKYVEFEFIISGNDIRGTNALTYYNEFKINSWKQPAEGIIENYVVDMVKKFGEPLTPNERGRIHELAEELVHKHLEDVYIGFRGVPGKGDLQKLPKVWWQKN